MTDTTELTDGELSVRVAKIEQWAGNLDVERIGYIPDYCNDLNRAMCLVENEVGFQLMRLEKSEWGYEWEAALETGKGRDDLPFSGCADNPARAIVLVYLDWKEREGA